MKLNFPTLEQVETADRYTLCKWHRFLSSADTEEKEKIQTRIFERWGEAGGFTPEISKQLGWG